ncbi:hypothetical protein O6H91_09G117900 [Diphasiastrum complanatum]|uniref:Uncharacterized protein n=1 Tax=Diphasiastrum complanatum TaxID=34168 RepID=A0ACC2CTP7_DIPCM|nr:hypothetical protein O6H91_09G117900 [Diphasiastrum complanatum]
MASERWLWRRRIASNSSSFFHFFARLPPPSILLLCTSLLLLFLPSLLLLLLSYHPPTALLASPHCRQCSSYHHHHPWMHPASLTLLPQHQKFMWYAPHSGFSNQIGELRNALRIAALLNRTLILPPVTDHHALKLGSCPKFRVIHPSQLRYMAWTHISHLIANSRYISIADIINITSVTPGLVRTIDFRVFALLWCGADIKSACAGPVCSHLAETVSVWGSLDQCGTLFTQTATHQQCCIGAVDDSCATTVWTFGEIKTTGSSGKTSAKLVQMDSIHLEKKAQKPKVRKEVFETLGPHSEVDKATVLAFGSLFSAKYRGSETHIDISLPSGNKAVDAVLEATQFLPFSDVILEAGELFSVQRMRQPYFCAQLRLLDGQFKNHWDKTFLGLKAKLEKVRIDHLKTKEKLAIFVMTDLPRVEWSGTYLGELAASDEFQLHILELEDELVLKVAKDTLIREHGLKSGFLPKGFVGIGKAMKWNITDLTDVRLCVEEVICACATLGFQGTSGSTITDNINELRASKTCSLQRM